MTDSNCFTGLRSLFKRPVSQAPPPATQAPHATMDGPKSNPTSIPFNSCDFYCDPVLINAPPPAYTLTTRGLPDDKVLKTIETSLDDLSLELRELSLKIHDHPELKWEEVYVHSVSFQRLILRSFHAATPTIPYVNSCKKQGSK